ncbi:MAG TPA: ABC transporter ATP-binding protein [Gemmatimonadales bacterium]|nr:ABC transporter ATP-binding protein [Gemmatimonadales bacterium]
MTAPAAGPPVVELIHISKRFGHVVAVDDLSLEIQSREFFSLLGPSGCGKTTTLRLLAGFETPDNGEIRLLGEPANQKRPYQRGVGMVFQNYALFPHLTVARNVSFGLEQQKIPRPVADDRVRRALQLVRLDPKLFADRLPGQLSGGQRQRVALARALVLQPAILLLDEPLGAIDLQLRKEMQLELKALNQHLGTTFVYVTHDQEEALTMSDRIAVMNHGKVAQLGTPVEIYENPRTTFVARFIGESNLLEGSAHRRQGNNWSVVLPDHGQEIQVPHHSSIHAGALVRVVVRPEWMQLLPPGELAPGLNTVTGSVRETLYAGPAVHVVVELPGSKSVSVAVHREGQLAKPIRWERGDPTLIAWHPQDSRVVTED